jgi:Domain of unknown function (DUF397)
MTDRTNAARDGAAGTKPTVESLGIDVDSQNWQRSGTGDGAIEIAMVGESAGDAAEVSDTTAQWVLMRVSGDAAGRVLVYDRHEWECFLDGVRAGEFDTAAS